MDRRIVLIRHGDDAADDRVGTYFRSRNVEPEFVRPFKGETLGDVDARVVASVIYGGLRPREPHDGAQHTWFMGFLDRLFGKVVD